MSRDAVPSSNGIFVVHPRRRTSRRIARNGIFPVWSHDGRRIAYVEPGAGSSPQHPHGTPNHVVVVTPAGRPLWRRTGSLAAWSPRGSRIAFVVGLDSAGVASARVVVASGGGAHVWTLEACRAEWSPDGSALALEATGPNCAGPNAIAQLGSRRIAVLPRSGGAVSWSADGRRIAWATGFPERGSILIGSAAGRISRTLPLWGSSLHWSPDGSHLLFGRPDGLWVVATDGSSRRRVARTYPYPTAHWVDARTIVYWTGPP
jgi:Tol biopolymer transport system component